MAVYLQRFSKVLTVAGRAGGNNTESFEQEEKVPGSKGGLEARSGGPGVGRGGTVVQGLQTRGAGSGEAGAGRVRSREQEGPEGGEEQQEHHMLEQTQTKERMDTLRRKL